MMCVLGINTTHTKCVLIISVLIPNVKRNQLTDPVDEAHTIRAQFSRNTLKDHPKGISRSLSQSLKEGRNYVL